jgi:pimeloyl-ACP methyl ester carboxylesterase
MTSQITRSPKTSLTFDRARSRIEGRGVPVVLLHSSMSSKGQWRELIHRMRDRHQLIAIDLHGYGETSLTQSADCFTLNDEVRLVESVLTSALRAGESFHLVGHSYGGVVALQLAQGQPHRVRSLSLFEPLPFHLLPDDDPGRAELHLVWRQIEASLKSDDAGGGAACFIDYWNGRGTFSQMPKGRQAAMCRLLPKTALEFQAVAREALRADAYRRIVAPTCLIAGRWSPQSAHASIWVLAELLPHARQHLVAAGHMAPVTHPALVNPIIERFIRTVDGAATPSGHWEALSSESQWPQTAALCP